MKDFTIQHICPKGIVYGYVAIIIGVTKEYALEHYSAVDEFFRYEKCFELIIKGDYLLTNSVLYLNSFDISKEYYLVYVDNNSCTNFICKKNVIDSLKISHFFKENYLL